MAYFIIRRKYSVIGSDGYLYLNGIHPASSFNTARAIVTGAGYRAAHFQKREDAEKLLKMLDQSLGWHIHKIK